MELPIKDIRQIIEDALFEAEGGWQSEELRRRNAKHAAGIVYDRLSAENVLVDVKVINA